MPRQLIVFIAVLAVVSGMGLTRLQAQGAAPTAYSYTEDPGIPLMGPEVVKVSRDGSKEVVDQVMPPMPGRDKEYHGHLLYDFKAHTLYTQVVSDPGSPCGVQRYTDAAPPSEFDIITGAGDTMKDLGTTKEVGTESLNGMATKVLDFSTPQSSGRIWLTVNGGYPVKLVLNGQNGAKMNYLEVKQLSFAKPPASVFALPASCASAQLPPPPPPPAKPGPNVTAVTLQKIGNYTGACPAHIKLAGSITVDGPGKVFYQFGAGNMEPGETVTFGAAGTKTVTHTITFQPKYGNQMGGSAILEAIGVDSAGNHGIPTLGSNNSDFNITCTSGGGQ